MDAVHHLKTIWILTTHCQVMCPVYSDCTSASQAVYIFPDLIRTTSYSVQIRLICFVMPKVLKINKTKRSASRASCTQLCSVLCRPNLPWDNHNIAWGSVTKTLQNTGKKSHHNNKYTEQNICICHGTNRSLAVTFNRFQSTVKTLYWNHQYCHGALFVAQSIKTKDPNQ